MKRSRMLNDVAATVQNASDVFLPLSVRHEAAEAAVAVVEAWLSRPTVTDSRLGIGTNRFGPERPVEGTG